MRRLYWRIKNFLGLKKILADKAEVVNRGHCSRIIKIGISYYKDFKKGSGERNLMAAVIKKLREKFKYQIQGWSESEKLYKDYFQMPLAIQDFSDLKEGVYLTKFRVEAPVKGEKFFEYYTNMIGYNHKEDSVIQLGKYKEKYEYFQFETPSAYDGVSEDDMTAYRYSTNEEIAAYKKEQKRKQDIEAQIKLKHQEISELYSKL